MPAPVKTCDVEQIRFQRSGPQWGEASDDLNVTVLSWQKGQGPDLHLNHELDVTWVVLDGEGEAIVEGETIPLRRGVVLLIPKGTTRGITSTSERLTYLSVHRRRPGLMPTFGGK